MTGSGGGSCSCSCAFKQQAAPSAGCRHHRPCLSRLLLQRAGPVPGWHVGVQTPGEPQQLRGGRGWRWLRGSLRMEVGGAFSPGCPAIPPGARPHSQPLCPRTQPPPSHPICLPPAPAASPDLPAVPGAGVQNTFGAAAFTSYGAFWMGFALLQILSAVRVPKLLLSTAGRRLAVF